MANQKVWTQKPPPGFQLKNGLYVPNVMGVPFNEYSLSTPVRNYANPANASNALGTVNSGFTQSMVGGKNGNRQRLNSAVATATGLYSWANDTAGVYPTTAVTILYGFNRLSGSLQAASAFSIHSGSDTLTAYVPYSDGTVYWDWNGSGAGSRITKSGLTFGDDVFCFTMGPQRGQEIWQNGSLVSTGTYGGARTAQGAVAFSIAGGGNFGNVADAGDWDFFYMWDYQVPASVIQELTVRPFSVFQNYKVKYWRGFSAGVINIPIPNASMAFTTYAPAVGPIKISVPAGSLAFATYAPSISVKTISVPSGALAFSTYAPSIVNNASIPIPKTSIALTTYAPTVLLANLGPCNERFGPKLYFWEPAFLERPEDTEMRATDWEDGGLEGAKFLQGFVLEADTQGVDKVIKVQGDQADLQTYTINHNGQQIKPYVFDPTQIASLLRIISPDGVDWRYFGVRWIWEPVPELVTYYETQGTTHDLSGYQFLKDGYISLISTADVTLTINVDGVNFVYTIPSTGGLYKKNYILFGINSSTGQTLKGKLYTYILASTAGFRLFQKDCEVRVHSWGSGDYQVRQPFGETSRVYGARI